MSTYLITGATGGLGSSVVEHLSKSIKPSEIAVLVRDAAGDQAKEYKSKGFEVRVADYDNKEKLTKAFKNIEILYFVSGSDIGSRTEQHKNVVDAATQGGVQHVMYTSAGRKDESQNSPVAAVMEAHIKTENWLKESGMAYTILRHNLYAEVIALFLGEKEALLQSKTVFLPTTDGKTAFALRDDLAEAGALILKDAAQHQNKIYTLDGPKAIDFKAVAEILSDILETEINYVSPDVDIFKTTMASYGVPEDIINMMLGFSLGIAQGEFNSESKDLENILSRKPKAISTLLEQIYG